MSLQGRAVIIAISVLAFVAFVTCNAKAQQAAAADDDLAAKFQQFRNEIKGSCGARGDSIVTGNLIVKNHGADELNRSVIEYVKKTMARVSAEDIACRERNSLPNLLKAFRNATEKECPELNVVRSIKKTILDLYENDEQYAAIILLVKEKTALAEIREYYCDAVADYQGAVRRKNWEEAYQRGKKLLLWEFSKESKIDLFIDLATIGHRLVAYGKNDVVSGETNAFAKDALELIADGKKTGKCWGFAICYDSKSKSEGWLNYIAGYLTYFKLGDTKKGLEFLYAATLTKSEFSDDAFLFHAAAIHYFSKQPGVVSYSSVNSFVTIAVNSTNLAAETGVSSADRAQYAYIRKLYEKLQALHRLGYGIAAEEYFPSFQDYVLRLVERPLIDPSADVKSAPRLSDW